jgi:hypothetical protein
LPGETRMQIDYKLCFFLLIGTSARSWSLLNETSWESRSWGKDKNKKLYHKNSRKLDRKVIDWKWLSCDLPKILSSSPALEHRPSVPSLSRPTLEELSGSVAYDL